MTIHYTNAQHFAVAEIALDSGCSGARKLWYHTNEDRVGALPTFCIKIGDVELYLDTKPFGQEGYEVRFSWCSGSGSLADAHTATTDLHIAGGVAERLQAVIDAGEES